MPEDTNEEGYDDDGQEDPCSDCRIQKKIGHLKIQLRVGKKKINGKTNKNGEN